MYKKITHLRRINPEYFKVLCHWSTEIEATEITEAEFDKHCLAN